ncbi:MAG: isochorismatase family protein [Nanobdellota archaeon]
MTSALLIIDMQEGFRAPESEAIIHSIKRLLGSFEGKMLFSAFENKRHSLFETQLHWLSFQQDDDKKIFSEFETQVKKTFTHSGYTVLTNELKDYLCQQNISKVYLAGVFTDVCVIKTAMDLFDSGIETFVIGDSCMSLHGTEIHNGAILSLKKILGEDHVIASEDVALDTLA